jgi:NADH-quinone oxidoreductase subunit L
MTPSSAAQSLALVGVVAPLVLAFVLGVASFVDRPLPERVTGVLVRVAFGVSFLSLLGVAVALVTLVPTGGSHLVVTLGRWFEAGDYVFAPTLLLDRLSLSFALFAVALIGVTAVFAHRYLHREPGYNRFFVHLALFGAGAPLVVLAGGIETAFAGWELLGLSSAMLVAFFHDRPAPVRNGLRIFVVYRIGDVALLSAAVLVHHYLGTGSFAALAGGVAWPGGVVSLPPRSADAVGLLLLVAAMAKSAMVPFSGWLPRAMEGPTPSGAIFYGAISIHAGAYLLLRTGTIFERAPIASAAVVAVGVATALHATAVGRVQTDIKSALAYASMTQVGVILVEIGLGLRWLPLVHMIGHASVRSLQFLRAPSLLHDFHEVENAVGDHLARTGLHYERVLSAGTRRRLYRASLERGDLDGWLDTCVVRPFLAVFRGLDRLEQRWCRLIGERGGGATPSESPPGRPIDPGPQEIPLREDRRRA